MSRLHVLSFGVDTTLNNYTNPLTCCENDAKVFGETLKKLYNLEKTQVEIFGSATTKVSFFEFKLKEMASELDAGDTLILYYSGHGGFIPDHDNDEMDSSTENYDETYCFYDRMLVDDEVYNLLLNFKKGVNVLIFVDSCHSGDSWRELKSVPTEFPEKLFTLSKLSYIKNKNLYNNISRIRKEIQASIFFISACQSTQTAICGDPTSLFTTHLIKELVNDPKISLQALAEKLQYDSVLKEQKQIPYFFQFNFNNSSIRDLSKSVKKVPNAPLTKAIYLSFKKLPDFQELKSILEKCTDWKHSLETWDNDTIIVKFEQPQYLSKKELQNFETILKKHFGIDLIQVDVDLEIDEPPQYTKSNNEANTNEFLKTWPSPTSDIFDWYKKEEYSQLESACKEILELFPDPKQRKVKIAIIDTGVIPEHPCSPEFLNMEAGRSFVEGEDSKNAMVRNKGSKNNFHGVATAAILAGKTVDPSKGRYDGKSGPIGAIPFAEVVPIRIADNVVLIGGSIKSFVQAIEYAIEVKCDVISMSMGGAPSRKMAEVINKAYEAGIVVVTAAGNNFNTLGDILVPEEVVYPSRFERVITACGATYNHKPYDFKAQKNKSFSDGERMQGNSGPPEVMKYALAAYTPNVPWASVLSNAKNKISSWGISRRGGGTSSATPQIAAAAALYIVKYRSELEKYSGKDRWKKAEAVRQALFRSAISSKYTKSTKYYGNGILQAKDALAKFYKVKDSDIAPKAKVEFGDLLKLYF